MATLKKPNVPVVLTFEQKVTAAWAYHVRGIPQQDIAAMLGVNAERVAEACKAVETALDAQKNQEPDDLWKKLRP